MGPGIAAEPEDGRSSTNTAGVSADEGRARPATPLPARSQGLLLHRVPAEAHCIRQSLTKEAEPVGDYMALLQGIGLYECRGLAQQVRGP